MAGSGKYLIICALTILTLNLNGSYRSEVYSAFVKNKMQNWKSAIDRMNKTSGMTDEQLSELVNYEYGYIAWCLGKSKNDEARKYLDRAQSHLDVLSQNTKNASLVNSYKSAFYGYRIALNKILFPFLGTKSLDCARIAVSIDKGNAFGYLQLGNIRFYTPSALGGSKKEALDYYMTALALMEKPGNDNRENWNYISILTVIAQSYYYLNDYNSSVSYIEKIIKIEPEYKWIKDVFYPKVIEKMKG